MFSKANCPGLPGLLIGDKNMAPGFTWSSVLCLFLLLMFLHTANGQNIFKGPVEKKKGGTDQEDNDPLTSTGGENGSYRRAFYVEVLGSGLGLSGNFDMRFKKDRNDGFGFRTGLGLGSIYSSTPDKNENDSRRYVTFPLSANYILGKKRSGFEGGAGLTTQVALAKVLDNNPSYMAFGALNVGYRLQPLRKGLLLRASWTPLFDNSGFYPAWAGVSVGYSFN